MRVVSCRIYDEEEASLQHTYEGERIAKKPPSNENNINHLLLSHMKHSHFQAISDSRFSEPRDCSIAKRETASLMCIQGDTNERVVKQKERDIPTEALCLPNIKPRRGADFFWQVRASSAAAAALGPN